MHVTQTAGHRLLRLPQVISRDEADEDWDWDDAASDATQLNEEGWAQESSSDDDDEGGENQKAAAAAAGLTHEELAC